MYTIGQMWKHWTKMNNATIESKDFHMTEWTLDALMQFLAPTGALQVSMRLFWYTTSHHYTHFQFSLVSTPIWQNSCSMQLWATHATNNQIHKYCKKKLSERPDNVCRQQCPLELYKGSKALWQCCNTPRSDKPTNATIIIGQVEASRGQVEASRGQV